MMLGFLTDFRALIRDILSTVNHNYDILFHRYRQPLPLDNINDKDLFTCYIVNDFASRQV